MDKYQELLRERAIKMTSPKDTTNKPQACIWGDCPMTKTDGRFRMHFCGRHYTKAQKLMRELMANFQDLTKDEAWNQVMIGASKFPLEQTLKDPLPPNLHNGKVNTKDDEEAFEKDIVQALKQEAHGVWKLQPVGKMRAGVPDLLIITNDGRVLLRELKMPGGRLTEPQIRMNSKLQANIDKFSFGIWEPKDYTDGTILGEVNS